MSRFYFDLHTPSGPELDDIGSPFETLEAAYLDACQAALEISIELLRKREDPSRYRFEIRADDKRLILDLPFSEVLQPRPRPVLAPLGFSQTVQGSLRRARELQAEVNAGLIEARQSLEAVRATLRRTGG